MRKEKELRRKPLIMLINLFLLILQEILLHLGQLVMLFLYVFLGLKFFRTPSAWVLFGLLLLIAEAVAEFFTLAYRQANRPRLHIHEWVGGNCAVCGWSKLDVNTDVEAWLRERNSSRS